VLGRSPGKPNELRLTQLTKSTFCNCAFDEFKQGIARPGSILNLESKIALRQTSARQRPGRNKGTLSVTMGSSGRSKEPPVSPDSNKLRVSSRLSRQNRGFVRGSEIFASRVQNTSAAVIGRSGSRWCAFARFNPPKTLGYKREYRGKYSRQTLWTQYVWLPGHFADLPNLLVHYNIGAKSRIVYSGSERSRQQRILL
jgi:hypothetical protein